jgi:hypothetical protein
VPEEFAAAYWAAYEQALAAQTDGPHHREDTRPRSPGGSSTTADADAVEELPRRHGALRVGTHRAAESYAERAPTRFERVRDSAWFVPALLLVLALLLIIGAYTAGRAFSNRIMGDAMALAGPACDLVKVRSPGAS